MKRTFDELVDHFISQVRQMKIKELDKMALIGMITMIQTEHQEQKHGKWIPHPNKEYREWDVCTACGIGSKRREYGTNPNGTEYVREFGWKFCPNCGARLDGVK